MSRRLIAAAVFCLLMLQGFRVTAQTALIDYYEFLQKAAFPENYEVRADLQSQILAPAYTALHAPSSVYSQAITPGMMIAFDVRKTDEAFYMLFRNQQPGGEYPTVARGNWIIKRDLESGDFLQVKIFLQDEEDCFLRLYPDGRRSTMEIVIQGRQIYNDVTVPLPLEDILVSPFARLMRLTETYIDWNAIFTDPSYAEWETVAYIAEESRRQLPLMTEVYDGAQNSQGQFVYIGSGEAQQNEQGFNCSGFAKWVADGIYAGYNALTPEDVESYLPVDALSLRHLELRGADNPWSSQQEERRDPYFALDWVRNIAAELFREYSGEMRTDYTRFDVSRAPFFQFIENVGYPAEDLESLMYLLAVKNPGYIYFAAVSSPYQNNSNLRLYHHVAVFFPYFTPEGEFILVILETGEETSPADFIGKYSSSHLFLTKVRPGERFFPPSCEVP